MLHRFSSFLLGAMTLPSLVVFDFAGTLIDHGCRAPLTAFMRAFREAGLPIDEATARRPMGAHKREHIVEILGYPELAGTLRDRRIGPFVDALVSRIYKSFCAYLHETILSHAAPIPHAVECLRWLNTAGIPFGVTTGYTREMIQPLLPMVKAMGVNAAHIVCSDEVSAARPAPWACFRLAEKLGVFPLGTALKVGDTPLDVAEGLNAGMLSIGVSLSGNETGLSHAQLCHLEPEERFSLHERASRLLRANGAHDVLESVARLPAWIESRL
jgi:phosphonoacetaldehyde hydrolase